MNHEKKNLNFIVSICTSSVVSSARGVPIWNKKKLGKVVNVAFHVIRKHYTDDLFLYIAGWFLFSKNDFEVIFSNVQTLLFIYPKVFFVFQTFHCCEIRLFGNFYFKLMIGVRQISLIFCTGANLKKNYQFAILWR